MQDKIESPEGAVGGTLGCGTILRIRGAPLLCSLLTLNLRPLRLLPLRPRVSPANSSLCEFAVRRHASHQASYTAWQRASEQWEMDRTSIQKTKLAATQSDVDIHGF